MTLVLSDSSFANQTENSIRRVVNTKWNSLKTLDAITPIQTLDFCVSFSSVCALFGNHGQSNYAMANTIVDGHLARYKNAFSIAVPSISGLGYVARIKGLQDRYLESVMISPDGKPLITVCNLQPNLFNRPLCLPSGRLAQALLWGTRALLHH
jgi:hypothetical protein